jgi:outer membrane protein assembly factor BamD (BamD/ComL family)
MAKKTTRKELLKSPDEFLTLSSRAIQYAKTHQRRLKIVGIAVAVAALAYLAVQSYFRHINAGGQETYNTAYRSLAEKTGPQPSAEGLKEAETLFRKVEEEYGLSKAAMLAAPQIAYLKFESRDYDAAIAEYQRFLKKFSDRPAYGGLAKLALAACHEAKGDFKTAIGLLSPFSADDRADFRETAVWGLARLYRLDNQPEKARETLNAFIAKYPDSPLVPTAKALL